MIVRLGLLVVVLGAGLVVGLVGRKAAHRQARGDLSHADGISPGLWLFTAPYCHRCVRLRDRLDSVAPVIAYETVDVCERPDLVRSLDIRSAPTVLAVGANGQVQAWLTGDDTDEELDRVLDLVMEYRGRRASPVRAGGAEERLRTRTSQRRQKR